MNKQVLSIDQMNHLKALGLDTSKASCYIWESDGKEYLYWGKCEDINGIPAFTLQDILQLLPYKIVASYLNIGKKSFSGDILFYTEYSNFGGYAVSQFRSESVLQSVYEMLCWCIENGFVK